MYCLSQCSGHGECVVGFCKCHAGWYGADCSRKVAGQPLEQGGRAAARLCFWRLTLLAALGSHCPAATLDAQHVSCCTAAAEL
jgi:hypothetical protein